MKFLIVGLGNIGSEYAHTRHNIGFDTLDAFAEASNVVFEDKRYGAVAIAKVKGHQLILLKPSTYMNLSGNAVRYWMQQENIPLEQVLVIVDDLALPFGALRLKGKGSDAGHNGLKNIIAHLGHDTFMRVKMGVGEKPKGYDLADYVLGHFSSGERKLMDEAAKTAVEAIRMMMAGDVDKAMNQFNRKSTQQS